MMGPLSLQQRGEDILQTKEASACCSKFVEINHGALCTAAEPQLW